MEASVAAAGQATAGGDAGGDAGEGGQAPDLASVAQSLTGVQETQNEMKTAMQQLIQGYQGQQGGQQQQAADDAGDDGADDGFSAAEYDMSFLEDPAVVDDPAELRKAFEGMLKEAITPLVQNQQQLHGELLKDRRQAAYEDLTARFPDMGKPETFDPIVNTTRDLLTRNGWPAGLVNDPNMLELVYLGERAHAQAQRELEGQEVQTGHIEGGGGATQAGTTMTNDQQADAIVASDRKGRNALPFA